MHNPKRRQNNMNAGNGGGQQRHGNRPRRFGGGMGRSGGGDDASNVSRTRRNATQAREKYQNMARDAMSMGDRVLAENYLQHADHYYRILLSLPPEEVRQPRHFTPGNGGQAEDGGYEAGDSAMGGESSHGSETRQAEMPAASTLPAFITQPASLGENPSQENLPHE